MIAQSCAADQAHLRSHSGPGSSEVFHGSPTQLEIHRLPLHITEALCECGRKARPSWTPQSSLCTIGSIEESSDTDRERTLARVCREAGAAVRTNVKLRDMSISVSAPDNRAMATGLPFHQGAQLAIDITLKSALTTTGEPCPGGATTNGAALQSARQQKQAKYRSSLRFDRCWR